MNKNKINIIISFTLVILWMIVIFCFSNMNSKISNEKSKGTIFNIVNIIIDTSTDLGLIKENIPKEERKEIVNRLNMPLRKVMHFSIYLVLALLLINALNKTSIKKIYIISFMICFIYALLDEYHQTFVSGRTGQFRDVLIDSFGSFIGIMLYITLKNVKKVKKTRL